MPNLAVDLAHFGRWTLRDKAAQRRSPPFVGHFQFFAEGTMNIEFDDEAVWVAERTSVFFRAKADGKNVRCFVSREALDDHFGGDNAHDYVPIFRNHRNEILAVTEKMISAGCVSPAGELIVAAKFFP